MAILLAPGAAQGGRVKVTGTKTLSRTAVGRRCHRETDRLDRSASIASVKAAETGEVDHRHILTRTEVADRVSKIGISHSGTYHDGHTTKVAVLAADAACVARWCAPP